MAETKARKLANLIDASGDIQATNLDNVAASNNASALTTGTLPDGRFPATLPAVSGANLTGIAAFPTGWSAALDGSDMVFIYNSVEVFKITTAGAVVAKDNVTAFGTP